MSDNKRKSNPRRCNMCGEELGDAEFHPNCLIKKCCLETLRDMELRRLGKK